MTTHIKLGIILLIEALLITILFMNDKLTDWHISFLITILLLAAVMLLSSCFY
jgi:hypothetical protein